MTVPALDRIEECIRRGDDATADEFRDALAALADLDALVQAAKDAAVGLVKIAEKEGT